MFDKPRLALMITYGALPNLAAYALINLVKLYVGADFVMNVLLQLFVGFASWYPVIVETMARFAEWDENRRGGVRPVRDAQPTEKRILLDMNTGKPMYAFQTPVVKIDVMSRKIKHFCIVLVNQREHGFKIDLKEETWKKHFGGRDNYVYVRDVRLSGAFAKESSRTNSPFVVTDWRIVEEGAKGRLS
jgi:hypothetical protein